MILSQQPPLGFSRPMVWAALFAATLCCSGCRKHVVITSALATAEQSQGRTDLARLLTSDEIQAVVGEPLRQAVSNSRAEEGFSVSQCYFATSTPSNSVALTVTERGAGSDAQDPRAFWEEKFHPDTDELEGKRDEAQEEGRPRTPPQKIDGIGDEAFWLASGQMGALYVLKEHAFFRVAIGGADDPAAKISKSKRLAQFVLERL